jgi:hypothetical protein
MGEGDAVVAQSSSGGQGPAVLVAEIGRGRSDHSNRERISGSAQ